MESILKFVWFSILQSIWSSIAPTTVRKLDSCVVNMSFHQDFIQEFLEKAVTFRELFPTGEERLLQAANEFFDE